MARGPIARQLAPMGQTQQDDVSDEERTEWAGFHGLFAGGPPRRLTALALLPAPICRNGTDRVLLVFFVGWVPLFILAGLAPVETGAADSFLRDIGVHARLAIAAPLLVLSYSVCADRLGLIAVNFLHSGLIDDTKKQPFVARLVATRRFIDSLRVEAASILATYALVFAIFAGEPDLFRQAAWQRGTLVLGLSPAGWWNLLVGMPLLVLLLLGWLWRILLWTRFLRFVAGLDLRLVAAHPDQAGGLGFLAQSVRAFAAPGMALGAISAARFAQVYSSGEATKYTNGLLMGGTAGLALLLFIGPLTSFVSPLIRCWRTGSAAYGALASDLGQRFEDRWFGRDDGSRPEVLSAPDFSAAADLYGVVSNVYAMRFLPVELRSVIILLGATLAPFLPAMLMLMPIDVVLGELKGLMF